MAAKVAADAGAPRWPLEALQVASLGLLGFLAADRLRGGWLDAPRALVLALAVLLLPTVYGEVGGDGTQAFVVVRSALIDHDLALANDYRGLGARPMGTGSGEATSHLPVGLALLWTVPFVLAHAVTAGASVFGAGVAADGFSAPYRSAVTAATYVYGVAALLLLESEVRRRQGRAVALLAVLALWLATPLHFYMTANPAMAHGASAFATTAFVVAWLRGRGREGEPGAGRRWMILGLLGAVLTLVRLQDVVLLALPVLDVAWTRPPRWTGLVARYALAAGALGVVQLAFWLRLYGTGFVETILAVNLVGGTGPHVLGVLFSWRHGLFTWTPLYAACVAGWLVWLRHEPRPAALVVLGFAASVLLNASMQDWWGAEAFGQRRLLGLTPLFGLGLGEALALVPRRRLWAPACVLALLALWNVSFEGIYNRGMVANREQAITFRQLARAQREVALHRWVRADGRVPPALWVRGYALLGGSWLQDGTATIVDLGAEPADLPFLIGRGWYDPETADGLTFRRSRGRGSWIRVPLREAGGYEAVVRLRPTMPDVPLTVTFEVNREPEGAATVVPGWSEYRFPVPAGIVRAGLNDVGLVYSTTPREARPGAPGGNAAVAVDWIALRHLQ